MVPGLITSLILINNKMVRAITGIIMAIVFLGLLSDTKTMVARQKLSNPDRELVAISVIEIKRNKEEYLINDLLLSMT